MNWWKAGIGVIGVIGVIGIGWVVSRPVPGTRMEDQGREHVSVEEVAAYIYNSNPPTSGPHLPTWVKAGVYSSPQSEGELIHSLEHGYVIISYNCNVHLNASLPVIPAIGVGDDKIISKVFAHEEDSQATPSATFDPPGQSTDPSGKTGPYVEGRGFYPEGKFPFEATGSAVNEGDGCKTIVKQLEELANKKKLWKLIVVPRLQLDTTIALTAWTYLDTFDQFDAGRIERFIDYHRDQGPEKTME